MGGLSGYFAGGMAKGIESGLRTIEASRRTDIFQQEQDTRNAEEVRKAQTYADDLTPIPLEVGKQAFKDPDHAEYAVGQARSMGIVRKDPQTGAEYVYKKDARELAKYLKDPNVIKQAADYRLDATRSRLDAAEAALKGNETDTVLALDVANKKRAYQLARAQHPELATIDRDEAKAAREVVVVPEGSRVVKKEGGTEVVGSVPRTPKTLSEIWADRVNKGEVSLEEATLHSKDKPASSSAETSETKIRGAILAKIAKGIPLTPGEQKIMSMKTGSRDEEDRDYRRQERLDKAFGVDEDKLKKQYDKDVIDMGEEKAKVKWNIEVRALQKKYIPKYKNIGIDFYSGESIDQEIPTPAPAPVQAQAALVAPTPAKSGGLAGTAKSSGGAGPGKKPQKGQAEGTLYIKEGTDDGIVVAPDGTRRKVKVDLKSGQVRYLQ